MSRMTLLSAVAVAGLLVGSWSQSGGQDSPPPPALGPKQQLPDYDDVPTPTPPRTTWEYRVVTAHSLDILVGDPDVEYVGQNLEAGLNMLGREGWELVAIDSSIAAPGQSAGASQSRYIFKRNTSFSESDVPVPPPPPVE